MGRGANADSESNEGVSVAPDGSRIAFASRANDIIVADLDQSNVAKLTDRLYAFQPLWSPDGSRILFGTAGRPQGIQVANADGTGILEVGSGMDPRWSPDGSQIAFVAVERDHSDIGVMSANGTDPRVLTDGSTFVLRPSWAPDGSRIAFETLSNDRVLLQVVNVDGSNRTTLADLLVFLMVGMRPVSWSPDGSRLVFARMPVPLTELASAGPEVGVDIYSVDADGSNLTRLTAEGTNVEPTWSPTRRCGTALRGAGCAGIAASPSGGLVEREPR